MGIMNFIKEALREPTKDELTFTKIEEIYSTSYFQPQLEKVISKSMPMNNEFLLEKFPKNISTVWKYNVYYPKRIKRFEKDDKNEHDKNAVKIIVDNTQIGYIPSERAYKFRKLMDEKRIYNINLKISGGEYIKKSDKSKEYYKSSVNCYVKMYLLIRK